MTTTPIAWQVLEPGRKATDRPHELSRRFHVKSAAEQFMEIARRSGHPEAYVATHERVGQDEAP
jgi:hypothetical protein